MTAMADFSDTLGNPFRRVWIKGFWGFSPENEDFLGFKREGDRARFFRQYQRATSF